MEENITENPPMLPVKGKLYPLLDHLTQVKYGDVGQSIQHHCPHFDCSWSPEYESCSYESCRLKRAEHGGTL